jgi:heme-degrading monooxygenase HmoA
MDFPARTAEPPYYAVIFTSWRTPADAEGYAVTAERMLELAASRLGFLGVESVHAADGQGITVSYWDSLESIRRWGRDAEHRLAQAGGRSKWYAAYRLRVCRVERDDQFHPPANT